MEATLMVQTHQDNVQKGAAPESGVRTGVKNNLQDQIQLRPPQLPGQEESYIVENPLLNRNRKVAVRTLGQEENYIVESPLVYRKKTTLQENAEAGELMNEEALAQVQLGMHVRIYINMCEYIFVYMIYIYIYEYIYKYI